MDEVSASERWRMALPFLVVGTIGVVAGGVVAAFTGPAGWERGSWAAAYLVLVVGVAQVGMGAGQAILASHAPKWARLGLECVLWNGASGAVIVGALIEVPYLVGIAGVALLGAVGLFASAPRTTSRRYRWAARGYRFVLIVLTVSTPIGIAMSWSRS